MAEPGDPTVPEPKDAAVDHDDLIGFSSAAALRGAPRTVSDPVPDAAPPLLDRPAAIVPPRDAPVPPPATPDWAVPTPAPAPLGGVRHRSARVPKVVENATGLYAVYALILFAVPTLGVSALIALLAVTGRAGPANPEAASHFVFQQRTLWSGAVVALLGVILIAVGLGVFVLFILAVWLIFRGASGVLALKAGRPVRDPRGWFLA